GERVKEDGTMIPRKLLMVVGVCACLAGLVVLTRSPAASERAPAPAPPTAEDEVRRLEKALDDLEHAFVEQRVQARLNVAAKAQRLNAFEKEYTDRNREITGELRDLEQYMNRLQEVSRDPASQPQVRRLEQKIAELRKTKEEYDREQTKKQAELRK